MTNGDRQRFAVVMYWLAEKYPLERAPRELSESDLEEYFRVLKDIRIERIEWAGWYWYGHEVFFPNKPADLRATALKAPPSVIPSPPPLVQLEDKTPPDVARARLQEIFNDLNSRYDTRLSA